MYYAMLNLCLIQCRRLQLFFFSRKLKQVLFAINFCHSAFDQVILLWKKRWSYCALVYDSLFKLDFYVVPDLQKYIFKIPKK